MEFEGSTYRFPAVESALSVLLDDDALVRTGEASLALRVSDGFGVMPRLLRASLTPWCLFPPTLAAIAASVSGTTAAVAPRPRRMVAAMKVGNCIFRWLWMDEVVKRLA